MKSDQKVRWHQVELQSWGIWVFSALMVPALLVIMWYVVSTPMPPFERVLYIMAVLAAIVVTVVMAVVVYGDERSKKSEPEWYEITDRQEFLKRLRERLGKAA